MFKIYRPAEKPKKELRTLSLMHAMNDGYLAALPLLLPFASAELGLGFREAGIMTGAVTKGTVPVLNALVAKAVPDRRLYTEAFAFVSLLGGVSAAVAPVVLGALAQAAGVEYIFLACAAVALAATAPVIASSYASHRKDRKWN